LALLAVVNVSPPATSLTRVYLCFFDAGSAELSPRCQDAALGFVEWWLRIRSGEYRGMPNEAPWPARAMRVELNGRPDAAEAAAGKASVSKARAEAVAAFLRLNDMPSDLIEVTSWGATRPLVPAPGSEQQNRRVEFVLR
jgi:outer membrane protein OmpA-like peptidoglycan-associated protein